MVSENNELIIELWARLKSHIIVVVFDEFNKVDDDLIDEDLDKELRAAVRSHMGDSIDEEDDSSFDDDEY
jgi:hypothetical protein